MFAARLSSLLLVVAIGLAALAAFSATPGDEAEVRAFVTEFARSFGGARSPEEIAAFYSQDGSHIGSEGQRITGAAALARYFGPLVSRPVSFQIAHVSFISDRVALVDGFLRRDSVGSGTSLERLALVTRETSVGWKIVASRMAPEPAR